ncbi:MAG: hypothetical protein JO202_00960 [Ktedonobacteraceae bacterium]|nr:hypothetical protein [Ktedonobacteraceae bacterium]
MKNTWTTVRPQDIMFVEVGPDDDDGVMQISTLVEVGPDDDDGLHPAR